MGKENKDKIEEIDYKKQIEEFEKQLHKELKEETLVELGELYYRIGKNIQALNTFNKVLRLNPDNLKANTYKKMINEILDFYHKDRFNP